MNYCTECGEPLPDNVKFCPACGTPVLKTKKGSSPANAPTPTNTGGTLLSNENPYGHTDPDKLPEGYVIDERYKVIRKLGQGNFGAVYEVYDRTMEMEKALKVIPEVVINDKEAMLSLRKEAAIMVKLNHKNIVRVYDFHHKGEIKYIDMEYVDGQSLTELKLIKLNKKFSEQEVKAFALQIAEGLQYAHDHRVIHKDIKPQNIMLTKDGTIKLMDFGIAETVHSSMSRLKNTGSSGTLVYMSPEQLRGKDVGREADIYSLGATLYELLTGTPFYRGDIYSQIINEQPEPMAGISEQMNAVVLKCLEKEQKERFADGAEFIRTLKGKTEKQKEKKTPPVELPPPKPPAAEATAENEPPEAVPREPAKNKNKIIAGVALLLLLVIIAGIVHYANRSEPLRFKTADYPMFRANLQRTGVYHTKGVPVFHRVKWKFKTGFWIFSSPAVSNGVVYFGSDDSTLYTLNSRTGKVIWKFKTGNHIISSPAVSNGTVYFGSKDHYLYALDSRTGQVKWKFKTGGWIESSPAVSNGTVYFGNGNGYFYALVFVQK